MYIIRDMATGLDRGYDKDGKPDWVREHHLATKHHSYDIALKALSHIRKTHPQAAIVPAVN